MQHVTNEVVPGTLF